MKRLPMGMLGEDDALMMDGGSEGERATGSRVLVADDEVG